MGTPDASRSQEGKRSGLIMDDVVKWLSEGWRFRVKTSHDKRYITRRKGNLERSLGAYDGELWRKITSLIEESMEKKPEPPQLEELQALRDEVNFLSRRIDDLSILLPKTVHGKKWWLFTKIGVFARQIKSLKRNLSKLDSKYRDKFWGHEARLSKCQLDVKGLENIPISNLYERFKCSKCGSQHLITVKIKCTKCNTETWWGYSPK